ncbi:hypothetical protein AB1Y20_023396 [Prymnesium parvum]|uniref:Transmembrane protein 107 n=1 Tax=Prymnesium parvum TaxID=97485 RepID=A0AB34JGI7_PRYPA
MAASQPAAAPKQLTRKAAAALYNSQLRRNLGWFLQYADLRINGTGSERTLEGALFLSTNLAFVVAGGAFSGVGHAPAIGLMCDLAGTFSIWYHWEQCRLGGTKHPSVQLAMLFDYALAIPTVCVGLLYAASLGPDLPISAVVLSALAFSSLVAGWFYDKPRQYMLVHGLWHLFGAAAGVQLAQATEGISTLTGM